MQRQYQPHQITSVAEKYFSVLNLRDIFFQLLDNIVRNLPLELSSLNRHIYNIHQSNNIFHNIFPFDKVLQICGDVFEDFIKYFYVFVTQTT